MVNTSCVYPTLDSNAVSTIARPNFSIFHRKWNQCLTCVAWRENFDLIHTCKSKYWILTIFSAANHFGSLNSLSFFRQFYSAEYIFQEWFFARLMMSRPFRLADYRISIRIASSACPNKGTSLISFFFFSSSFFFNPRIKSLFYYSFFIIRSLTAQKCWHQEISLRLAYHKDMWLSRYSAPRRLSPWHNVGQHLANAWSFLFVSSLLLSIFLSDDNNATLEYELRVSLYVPHDFIFLIVFVCHRDQHYQQEDDIR